MIAIAHRQLRGLELQYIMWVRVVRCVLLITCGAWLVHGSWPTDLHGRYVVIGMMMAISEPLRNVARVRFAQSLHMHSSHAAMDTPLQTEEYMEYRPSERLFRMATVLPAWPANLFFGIVCDIERDRLEFVLAKLP